MTQHTDQDALREQVRARYAAAATKVTSGQGGCGCGQPAGCGCGDGCCGPATAEEPGFGAELYGALDRDRLPDAALLASLGCGNPTAVAELHEGETVLDLGSGGGIDVLLSAKRVGPTGKAYGLDMTDEMLHLARRNAIEAGATNVEFLKGQIEAIPLPAATVDVVISNCVVNLSTDKPAVFAETFRILKPGGRLGITDVVAEDQLSPADRAERGAWVGCIAGALSRSEYQAGLAAAGFTGVSVAFTHQVGDGLHSAVIKATKPSKPADADPAASRPSVPDPGPRPRWSWDPTLYAGSAAFYTQGRVAYPPELGERLATALGVDGSGRLLDVGCGPGSLTLLLAPYFAEALGVDADPDMLTEAARQAARAGIGNVSWRQLRAEELPADLPPPTVMTFAQSFHWMDQPRVAATARRMLINDGALVHVHATTHEGIDTDEQLPHPRPPRAAITALIQQYLGTARRAGRHVLPETATQGEGREVHIYRSAGFAGPHRIELPQRTVQRTVEELRASIYSLSSAAPHLFGSRLDAFDAQLRSLLDEAADDGLFSERLREIAVDIWR